MELSCFQKGGDRKRAILPPFFLQVNGQGRREGGNSDESVFFWEIGGGGGRNHLVLLLTIFPPLRFSPFTWFTRVDTLDGREERGKFGTSGV